MKRAIEIEYAREQRKLATPEETKMWELIRNRKFMNLKFSRQFPVVISSRPEKSTFYIADFYCRALRLIVEIDGPYHETQKIYDQARDEILNDLGYNILRIKNEQINEGIRNALHIISEFIAQLKRTETDSGR